MKELVEIARTWTARRGEPFALATLVHAEGSSYRRPGARMLIAADASAIGALSGGCLEDEVVARAREVLRTGAPSLMEFDTRLRFGCNGRIEILVEWVRGEFLDALTAALRERRNCRALTHTAAGTRMLREDEPAPEGGFVQLIEPAIQLLIFGDSPDSRPLRALGDLLGWTVREIAQTVDLPTALDSRTAAVVKSHNYGRDCAALRHLLPLGLRYVGLVGPRRRRDQLLGDLLDSGAEVEGELFAPAGLDLGAETPEEIAVAIVAEIQEVFAEASGEPLRDRKTPIHRWNVAPVCREKSVR
ncbi:MAG: XdhC family protein [Chthoniobacterales bacterium]